MKSTKLFIMGLVATCLGTVAWCCHLFTNVVFMATLRS